MRLAHHPDAVMALRDPTPEDPWRVLISGCLFGWGCGIDGTDYGMGGAGPSWLYGPAVCLVPFCPEQEGLGTPRTMPDIHDGDGNAVVGGTARVLDPDGHDLTAGMLTGARAMAAHALAERVDWALLTDMSAACGSQVISLGCRFDEPRRYQRGVGVATALLLAEGIPVVSQRDFRTVARLGRRVDPSVTVGDDLRDHHEHPWVLEHLPKGSRR